MGEMKTFAAKPHNNSRGRERKVREVDLSKVRFTAAIIGIIVFIAIVSLIASLLFLRPKTYTATFFDDANGDGVYAENEQVAEYTVKGWRFAFPKSFMETPLFFFGKYTATIGEETLTGDYIDIRGRRANLSLDLPIAVDKDNLLFTGWYQLDAKGNTLGNVATTKEFFSNSSKLDDYTFAAKYIKDYLTINSKGVITGITDKAAEGVNITNLVIPKVYNNIKVTGIGNAAFQGQQNLVSVTLPEGVTEIGTFAFAGCSSLKSINIPGTVKTVNSSAFKNCTALSGVQIPESVTAIADSAFENCSSLVSIDIPNTVKIISIAAFKGCSSLKSINIPENATLISDSAFANCYKLSSISIPASVVKIGESAFSDCIKLGDVTIVSDETNISSTAFAGCDNIKVLTAPISAFSKIPTTSLQTATINGGTEIPEGAFKGCTALVSITIPDSITAIGESAFENCASLVNIEIPGAVEAIADATFKGCTALDNIAIPESVTEIGASAFENCTAFTGIAIHDKITSVGASAFAGCDNIKTANAPICVISALPKASLQKVTINGDTEIPAGAFKDCAALVSITIPESVTEIGASAFENCAALTGIKIPEAVVAIADATFKGCTSLDSITIPENVTEIGASAFENCTVLNGIKIPEAVVAIADATFKGCTSLDSITIPESVTAIGASAFENCTAFTDIAIHDKVTSVGASAFAGCDNIKTANAPMCVVSALPKASLQTVTITAGTEIPAGVFKGCTALVSITIPDSITAIGASAFENCTSLVGIEIPEVITTIADATFKGCTALDNIVIPENVTEIGASAFENCTALAGIAIHDKITSIGASAFAGCTAFTSIEIPESVTALGAKAFANCTGVVSLVVGDGVTGISNEFVGCTALKKITIGDGVETIGASAFAGCAGLEEIVVGAHATAVDSTAFADCDGITAVTAPMCVLNAVPKAKLQTVTINGGDEIPAGAFKGSIALESIEIPASVVSIAIDAFANCPKLANIKVASENEKYASIHDGCLVAVNGDKNVLIVGCNDIGLCDNIHEIEKYAFAGDLNLTEITIPASVSVIADGAFEGCKNLASVKILGAVKTIGEGIFEGCTKLASVEIAVGAEVIGKNAFAGCAALQSIILPEGVKTIGEFAFSGTALTEITIPASVTEIADGAFKDCDVLAKVTVAEENTAYKIVNNCLVTASGNSGKKLVLATNNIKISADVVEIAPYAFNKLLTAVEIEGINWEVKDDVFANCPNVTTVVFGKDVNADKVAPLFKTCAKINNVTANLSVVDIFLNRGLAKLNVTLLAAGKIADGEFANCPAIYSLTISEGVTELGKNVFAGSVIENITLPKTLTVIGNSAFANCKKLTAITLPEGVTAIGASTFAGSALKEITLPTTLETVGDYVFKNCSGLTSFKIVSNLKNVSEAAFSGSSIKRVVIGKNVTEIYPFCGEKIESLTVEEGNTIYTDKANCILKGTTIVLACKTSDIVASGATAIAEKAFIGSVYTKITIPENIAEIATGAFYNCTNLTEIVIIDTDKSFAKYTSAIFEKCEKIAKVTLPAYDIACVPKNDLKTVIFSGGDVIPQEALKECTTLTSVIIPDGVTAIEPSAFEGCIKLANVTVPNGVTSIGAAAFDRCKSLKTIEIPFEVTAIGEKAFFGSGLTSIYIYDSVTSVGEYAFGNCTALKTIRISPYINTGLPANAFEGCNAITTAEAPTYALANINLAKVITLTVNDYEYGATFDASLLKNAKSLKTLNIGRGVTTISNIEYLDIAGVTFTVDENNESFEVVGGKINPRVVEE